MTRMLTPWTAWTPTLFDDFRKEMGRWMDRFGDSEEGGDLTRYFAPRVNFAESEKSYEVTVDLPGMKPEQFNVELKDGQLWITGQRQHEAEEKGKTFHRIERCCGQFRRVIALGDDVDPEKVEATYKDGVLSVSVCKVEAVRPKRIEVKS